MLAHPCYSMWTACGRAFWKKLASTQSRRYRFSTLHHCHHGGFAEFVSSDVRDMVLKQVAADSTKFKLVIEGKEVAVRRARTRQATERNAALRGAAETLTKFAEMDTNVVIEWGREGKPRGVTVKGSYAFTQLSGDSLGSFSGEFEHLDL